jgi:hypothetical protein
MRFQILAGDFQSANDGKRAGVIGDAPIAIPLDPPGGLICN